MTEGVPSAEAIPDSLLDDEQWLCWREADRDGRATKVPIDPTTEEFASTTDPETWSSFETALERARIGDERGVGFVFTEAEPIRGRRPRRLSRPSDRHRLGVGD